MTRAMTPNSMVTGNLQHAERDLLIRTDGPAFEFVRTYNSRVDHEGALGVGWSHTYELRIEPSADLRELTYLPASVSGFENDDEVAAVLHEG